MWSCLGAEGCYLDDPRGTVLAKHPRGAGEQGALAALDVRFHQIYAVEPGAGRKAVQRDRVDLSVWLAARPDTNPPAIVLWPACGNAATSRSQRPFAICNRLLPWPSRWPDGSARRAPVGGGIRRSLGSKLKTWPSGRPSATPMIEYEPDMHADVDKHASRRQQPLHCQQACGLVESREDCDENSVGGSRSSRSSRPRHRLTRSSSA